jgi:hypothetical protein
MKLFQPPLADWQSRSLLDYCFSMIVAISRFDKSSWPQTILRCESSFARSWIPTRRRRNLRTMGARRLTMRLRPSVLLLGASIFAAGTARAVDRGQFENIPDDIRAWFKGVRSPDGVTCCDISDGHRIRRTRRTLLGTNRRRVVASAGEGGHRNAGNLLGEAVVWYVSVRGNIIIRCFVPADASWDASLIATQGRSFRSDFAKSDA